MTRTIGFFVHHQGRGHAKRCEAIIRHLSDRPITILSARRDIFGDLDDRIRFIELPNMIGDPSQTPTLFAEPTPEVLHCAPLGSPLLRKNAGTIARFLDEDDPALFVVDVSAEWSLLSRLLSVPSVSVRMHGDRNDPGHLASYRASVGMVATFDAALEQDDYPAWARSKTAYCGGLCATVGPVPDRFAARRTLGLPDDQQIVLTLSGGGGTGTPWAPLTMAARALPDSLWLTAGPIHREGHETEFANLLHLGWVDDLTAHLAAADMVVASAGDNTVHEIARVGRPFLCIPEWRYFNEQTRKATALDSVGAAHMRATWPASLGEWRAAVAAAQAIDVRRQRSLFDPNAATKAAHYLENLVARLWSRPNAPALLAAE